MSINIELRVHYNYRDRAKALGARKEDLARALARACEAQEEYQDALREVESILGVEFSDLEIDDSQPMDELSVDGLTSSAEAFLRAQNSTPSA